MQYVQPPNPRMALSHMHPIAVPLLPRARGQGLCAQLYCSMKSHICISCLDKYLDGAGRHEDGLAGVEAAEAGVDQLQAVAVGAELAG